MISLSMTTALMLYLALTLIILFSLWGYHHYTLRNKKIIVSEEELFLCEYCHFAYLADRAKQVNKCPQCSSYNKGNKYRK